MQQWFELFYDSSSENLSSIENFINFWKKYSSIENEHFVVTKFAN